uniref:Nuclear receptor n=1 Tax=Pristionchus pacificus TaxID=54126 RepID=A0A8R1UVB1_PRIPA
MPTKGSSRQTDRDCIVCGQITRIAHLGIECCRACAVFYRRARRGNDYSCRSNTGQCAPGRGLNCKLCRYDRIVALLAPLQTVKSIDEPSPSTTAPVMPTKTARPLLDRVRAHYDTMCFNRLSSELNARPNPPHPLDISLENGPFYQADFAALIRAIRMLLTAALEFGRTTFPEFAQLSQSDKWALATNFFYRFRVFEGCFRANKIFLDEPNIYFVSYAGYSKIPFDETFLSTAPPGADTTGAMAYMRTSEMVSYFKRTRERIARVKPSEEEFLVIAVLMFFTYGDLSTSEHIHGLGEKYRTEILKELHAYYREELGMDDYATRIGELMMLIQMFEKTEDLKVQFEVMRLFNIMTDDNFVYQLKKDIGVQ